ncbi:ATP-dependent 6-phosphofructokinase 5, chloroplastic-like [Hibiscus syriacus]|uniref:ATP-dependent 6-phosphofructokinase 5, chloroplastic-like n=1 Tax=Hibiscus syriacus TaxID=106335 RepID=UPI001920D818|nr:ATP-dependent 6-phosphofructokinase 5, chloroplastic-like [Hibiscus syriacus]
MKTTNTKGGKQTSTSLVLSWELFLTPDEEWHGYINNNDRLLLKLIHYSSPTSAGAECIDPNCTWVEQWVHRAGPREKIYFKPEEVKAAIVTCGGLCPGLNDVITQIALTLEIYGVKNIVGIPFGYCGFSDKDLAEMAITIADSSPKYTPFR